jgi:serine/threonine protein kinase
MEPLSGRTLQEALRADGPLPVDEVTRVGVGLLDVLRATHRAGLVHRDVKPGNVHLCDGGRIVLTDFGVACTLETAASANGAFAGSPAYVSPERLEGRAFGPASDLFSLGATLFMAVEGRPSFDRGSLLATFTAIAEGSPAPFVRAGPLRIRGAAGRNELLHERGVDDGCPLDDPLDRLDELVDIGDARRSGARDLAVGSDRRIAPLVGWSGFGVTGMRVGRQPGRQCDRRHRS